MTARGPSTNSRQASHARALTRYRQQVLAFCGEHLDELFERAGTALLDFAERAESNTVQGRFFEAIAHINRGRERIAGCFQAEIEQGFEHFGNASPPSIGMEDLDDELSLIAPDEMEESVATENIIIKANANYFPELYSLSQRLAVVNDGKKLKDYEILAGPHHLVHAFRHALGTIELDVKIKIVIYALFDKLFMRQAHALYHDLNAILKEDGILPNIRPVNIKKAREREIRAKAEAEALAARQGDSEDSTTSLGSELFDSILELMSRRRGGARAGAQTRQPLAREQVVSAFKKVPSARVPTPPEAPPVGLDGVANVEVDERFLGRVKQTLSDEREQVLDALDRDRLAPVDADLIDLIGMLFEYMLNDPVLPNSAKALISHLHTPYLKVALIDRRLLVNRNHPARLLLDEMVEAGSLWVEEANPNRGIFPHIQRTVDRVIRDFDDDVSLFDELLADFQKAVAEQRKRTDSVEQRTKETARGRERLQLAKQRAAKEIQSLTKRRTLPAPVLDFLKRTWLDMLAFVVLRNEAGDDSEAWKEAVATAEQLVDLFDPTLEDEVRERRIVDAPRLQTRIGQSVRSMGSYNHAILDALNQLLANPEHWRDQRATEDTDERAAAPLMASEQIASPSSYMRAIVDDSNEESLSDDERAMIERLRKLKFGTWFEFTGDDGTTTKRIKLSWMSLLTSTCMFVDRSGMQAEIKTLGELAQEILSGRARVIPKQQHPFIERALVSVRKVLSQGEGGDDSRATGAARPRPPKD
jgi:hypothetical protein